MQERQEPKPLKFKNVLTSGISPNVGFATLARNVKQMDWIQSTPSTSRSVLVVNLSTKKTKQTYWRNVCFRAFLRKVKLNRSLLQSTLDQQVTLLEMEIKV